MYIYVQQLEGAGTSILISYRYAQLSYTVAAIPGSGKLYTLVYKHCGIYVRMD